MTKAFAVALVMAGAGLVFAAGKVDTVTVARIADGGYLLQPCVPREGCGSQVALEKNRRKAKELFDLAEKTRGSPDAGY